MSGLEEGGQLGGLLRGLRLGQHGAGGLDIFRLGPPVFHLVFRQVIVPRQESHGHLQGFGGVGVHLILDLQNQVVGDIHAGVDDLAPLNELAVGYIEQVALVGSASVVGHLNEHFAHIVLVDGVALDLHCGLAVGGLYRRRVRIFRGFLAAAGAPVHPVGQADAVLVVEGEIDEGIDVLSQDPVGEVVALGIDVGVLHTVPAIRQGGVVRGGVPNAVDAKAKEGYIRLPQDHGLAVFKPARHKGQGAVLETAPVFVAGDHLVALGVNIAYVKDGIAFFRIPAHRGQPAGEGGHDPIAPLIQVMERAVFVHIVVPCGVFLGGGNGVLDEQQPVMELRAEVPVVGGVLIDALVVQGIFVLGPEVQGLLVGG